jgi:hypothetical protein
MTASATRTTPDPKPAPRRRRPTTGHVRRQGATRPSLGSDARIDRRLVEMDVDIFLATYPDAMAYAEAEIEELLDW